MHTISIKCKKLEKEKVSNNFCKNCYFYFINNLYSAQDPSQSSLPAGIQKLSVTAAAQQKQQELLKQVAELQFVPKEPPPEFEFIADPPSISALDLYKKKLIFPLVVFINVILLYFTEIL